MKTVSHGLLKKQAMAQWMKRTLRSESPCLHPLHFHAQHLQQHTPIWRILSSTSWLVANRQRVSGHVGG